MKYPRFRVATVTGWPIRPGVPTSRSSKVKPELSAHVLDSLHRYALVASYHSTDRITRASQDGKQGGSDTRGHDGARLAAQEHADRLNEIHRLVLHREHMRESRDEL